MQCGKCGVHGRDPDVRSESEQRNEDPQRCSGCDQTLYCFRRRPYTWDLDEIANRIAKAGGTPLAVAIDERIYGVIYLKDTVKPGLKEKFAEMRAMGIKTIMCTGDNPLTAATIALEAGVDDFIAEAKPEDKIAAIKKEQQEGNSSP